MLAMAQLAFESDSTRIVTLMVDAFATPAFQLHDGENTTEGYHGLSHHGQAEEKVAPTRRSRPPADGALREAHRKTSPPSAKTADRLLDRTMVLFGSNMGDANTHDNTNLPILLAGGGFKHGQHLAFKPDNNTPLCNLFVTLLQQMASESMPSARAPAASTNTSGDGAPPLFVSVPPEVSWSLKESSQSRRGYSG